METMPVLLSSLGVVLTLASLSLTIHVLHIPPDEPFDEPELLPWEILLWEPPWES